MFSEAFSCHLFDVRILQAFPAKLFIQADFKEMINEGWDWVIIPSWIDEKYPKLVQIPSLFKEATKENLEESSRKF